MTSQEPTFERCIHDRKNPYVMISREMAQDKSISPKAKGVLLYLFSLPADWQIYHSQLQKGLGVGEDYVNSAMDELLKNGYAERTRTRINGTYQPYTYKIREFKKCSPNGKTPFGSCSLQEMPPQCVLNQTGFTGPGNPGLHKKEEIHTKETTTKETHVAVLSDNCKSIGTLALQQQPQKKPERTPPQLYEKPIQLQKPEIWPCLKSIEVAHEQKIKMTNKHTEETVKNAVEWIETQRNNIKTTLVQALWYGCNEGLSCAKLPQPENPQEIKERNVAIWREIEEKVFGCGIKKRFYYNVERIEVSDKNYLYFTDKTFLVQAESVLRKNDMWNKEIENLIKELK